MNNQESAPPQATMRTIPIATEAMEIDDGYFLASIPSSPEHESPMDISPVTTESATKRKSPPIFFEAPHIVYAGKNTKKEKLGIKEEAPAGEVTITLPNQP
jgi:hypothetical protein